MLAHRARLPLQLIQPVCPQASPVVGIHVAAVACPGDDAVDDDLTASLSEPEVRESSLVIATQRFLSNAPQVSF
jgi:hypothetical protein